MIEIVWKQRLSAGTENTQYSVLLVMQKCWYQQIFLVPTGTSMFDNPTAEHKKDILSFLNGV